MRWAPATHIEALLQPRTFVTSQPLLFYGMAKRVFGPIICAIAIVWQIIHVSATDCIFGPTFRAARSGRLMLQPVAKPRAADNKHAAPGNSEHLVLLHPTPGHSSLKRADYDC
jgi:hypothetical protein